MRRVSWPCIKVVLKHQLEQHSARLHAPALTATKRPAASTDAIAATPNHLNMPPLHLGIRYSLSFESTSLVRNRRIPSRHVAVVIVIGTDHKK